VLCVRPGITDPASILYRDEEKLLAEQADPESYYREVVMPEKLRLNLEYSSDFSFCGDVSLLLRTIACLLVPDRPHETTIPVARVRL
jgi:lipopolysaccharide/colanic/teichoic acid biosynthesis glycosyltransferase